MNYPPPWHWATSRCDLDLLYGVRCHRLPSLDTAQAEVWTLREDESGFGISGPKRRKYASLLPFLQQGDFSSIRLIGGAHSNHVVGLLQLLRERRLPVELWLRAPRHDALRGNRLLLHLLAQPEEIRWLSGAEWPEVLHLAQAPGAYVVPEGGSCGPALPGAVTLLAEIERQEAALGQAFDAVVLDAGSGFSAAALGWAMAWRQHPARLQVVCLAGEAALHEAWTLVGEHWRAQGGPALPAVPGLPACHLPPTARAYGSVNARVRAETLRLAREEGLLTDPVYTTKLFLTARHLLQAGQLRGRVLVIHTGGGTGLMGFGEGWGE